MKVRIQVTLEDIEEGCRCEPRDCAVARAMTRTIGAEVHVANVCWYFAKYSFGTEGVRKAYPLPSFVQAFINRFDHYPCRARPIEFTVDVPTPTLKYERIHAPVEVLVVT